MSLSKAIESMKKHCEITGLPLFYKHDLEKDFEIIEKYGDVQYVWMLRECGSLLFPLRTGANPLHIRFYVENDPTARFFFVSGFEETEFEQIHKYKAFDLVGEPPINFSAIATASDLIARIKLILTDEDIVCSVFKDEVGFSVEPYNWNTWMNHFKGKNQVLENVMCSAISKLKALV